MDLIQDFFQVWNGRVICCVFMVEFQVFFIRFFVCNEGLVCILLG